MYLICGNLVNTGTITVSSTGLVQSSYAGMKITNTGTISVVNSNFYDASETLIATILSEGAAYSWNTTLLGWKAA